MSKFDGQATKSLLDKNLITENQYQEINAYRNLNIFSLNAELKLFLYLSVLLFTSGIGILIYNNIDKSTNKKLSFKQKVADTSYFHLICKFNLLPL